MAKRKLTGEDVDAVRRSSRNKETIDTDRTQAKKAKTASTEKPRHTKDKDVNVSQGTADKRTSTDSKRDIPKSDSQPTSNTSSERQYWLMKAEPESRLEKGHDVKFSIDDLASKTVPEPWDGIRNHVAKNNLRAMKKGDLAFFYHSSCKVPAIVGMMEIVMEHTPDPQDPKAAYYDPKDDNEEKPKWSVVHVVFREKFKHEITLQELRKLAALSDGLENLQMLKQTRLSVSKVSAGEWEYLHRWLNEQDNVAKE